MARADSDPHAGVSLESGVEWAGEPHAVNRDELDATAALLEVAVRAAG